jgi:hypothetical protein
MQVFAAKDNISLAIKLVGILLDETYKKADFLFAS